MKLLITGGLGYIGSWLTCHFSKRGYEVHILSRSFKRSLPGVEYRLIQGDITDPEGLKSKLRAEYDYCIHAASSTDRYGEGFAGRAADVNVNGTRNVLEAVAGSRLKRFVYFSTYHVYGVPNGVLDESARPNPQDLYSVTHLGGESEVLELAREGALPYTILRPTNGYGTPFFMDSPCWDLVLNSLVLSVWRTGKIVLKSNGRAMRDFIWIGDICRAAQSVMETDKAAGEIFNVSTGRCLSISDVAGIVGEVFEKRYGRQVHLEPNLEDCSAYEPFQINNAKLKAFVGFEPQDRLREESENILEFLEREDAAPRFRCNADV